MSAKVLSTIVALAALALCGSGRCAGAADAKADADFVTKASAANMQEIQTSGMAEGKAMDPDVKAFAKHMSADHQKAAGELNTIVGPKGLKTSTGTEPELIAVMQKLGPMAPGRRFDKAYMSQMVKDHEKAVALFDDEAKNGADPDIKAWAEKMVPTLKEHLKMAQDTAKKIGADEEKKDQK